MNLYLITQDSNDRWDHYNGAVVIAKDETDARNFDLDPEQFDMWVTPDEVKVKLIGTAIKGSKPGLILAELREG